MTFGEKLLQLRKNRGMSQEGLAAQLNVSRQAISRWETDISYPDSRNLMKIGQLFGVTTDDLLHGNFPSDIDNACVKEEEKSIQEKHENIAGVIGKIGAKQKKLNNIILLSYIAEFIILCTAGFLLKRNWEYFFVAGTLLCVGIMAMLIFRYVVNTKSYDLLAGVDTRKYRYDTTLLDKVMLSIEFIFLVNSIVTGNVIMGIALIKRVTDVQEDLMPLIVCIAGVVGTVAAIFAVSKSFQPLEEIK